MSKNSNDPHRLAPLGQGFWRTFFKWEASTGIILLFAAVAALIVANSPLYGLYKQFLDFPVFANLSTESFHLPETVLLFINDALMAVFFLLVGLEIKREFVEGELSSFDRAILPIIAAVCGMAVPAAIFIGINADNVENWRGWAIPSATDIAFAVGAISVLGSRVSIAMKVFLVAVAVIDDLGAILIIAAFYSSNLHMIPLFFAGLLLLALIAMNFFGVRRLSLYMVVGFFVWLLVLQSGIHATIAGVAVAMTIPIGHKSHAESPLTRLEKSLLYGVNFAILPLFGFANAGVNLTGVTFNTIFQPLPLGIILGLFFGKQIGIFISSFIAIKTGIARKPGGSWLQLYGISLFCGIGFTMSLFIGNLAFSDADSAISIRIGVLVGSLVALVAGYVLLRFAPRHYEHSPEYIKSHAKAKE